MSEGVVEGDRAQAVIGFFHRGQAALTRGSLTGVVLTAFDLVDGNCTCRCCITFLK
jgi:hypothetical protein